MEVVALASFMGFQRYHRPSDYAIGPAPLGHYGKVPRCSKRFREHWFGAIRGKLRRGARIPQRDTELHPCLSARGGGDALKQLDALLNTDVVKARFVSEVQLVAAADEQAPAIWNFSRF